MLPFTVGISSDDIRLVTIPFCTECELPLRWIMFNWFERWVDGSAGKSDLFKSLQKGIIQRSQLTHFPLDRSRS